MYILIGAAVLLLLAWIVFWNVQGWLLSHRSGYFAPRLSKLPQLARLLLAATVGRWFVGPITVHGWENLEGVDGRFVVAPNHQLEADIFLVCRGLGLRVVRFLMAINQTQGFFRAPFFAWMGAISVGYDPKNPASAAAASAVNVMEHEDDSTLIIFPQGTLIRDDVWDRKQFHRGAVKIARLSEERTGTPFFVVPVVAQYDYNPQNATPFHRLVARLGIKRRFFGRTIYGATIMIGKPLAIASLPRDDDAAMDVYYEAMLATRLLCQGKCM